MAESQAFTQLAEHYYDDPSQLSQLLRQRAGSERPFHCTTSTESHQSGFAAAAPAIGPADSPRRDPTELLLHSPVATARPHHATSPRRVTTSRYVKPSLPTSHSAPPSTAAPVEKKFMPKMYHSFAYGGLDGPGDTQPDSQMQKQYTSGIHSTGENQRKLPDAKSLFAEHVSEDEDGDIISERSEVVESSQEQKSPTVTSPTVMHEDESLGIQPAYEYAETSPLKFETPAVVGRKRDNSGQLLSSAHRSNTTPGTVLSTSAFPGFNVGGIAPMSLTQIWHNTQAPTSPVAAEATDDAAFTRPSPNFTHVRQSSPVPVTSSPTKTMRPGTPLSEPVLRSSSEPRAEYVSMKESQERRRRTTREVPVPAFEQEDSWDQPSAAQLRMQKLRAREELDRKAAVSLANVSAPSPVSPQRGGKRNRRKDVGSPIPSRTSLRTRSGPENIGLELVHGSYRDATPEELSQEMPLETPAAVKGDTDNVQVPQTSSHAPRTSNHSLQATPSSQLQRETQRALENTTSQKDNTRPQSSKDSVAITDSQPDTTAIYESIPRPKSLRFPSSPSTNQYSINQTTMASKTGYTSQLLPSSMPPMPPRSSQDGLEDVLEEEELAHNEEGRVPSSPPLATHEDDFIYDEHEHAYDEYATGDEVPNSPEAETRDAFVNGEDAVDDDDNQTEEEVLSGHDELDLVQSDIVNSTSHKQVSRISGRRTIPKTDGETHLHDTSTRLRRQNTVPETDALEDTQPSVFPIDNGTVDANHASTSAASGHAENHDTNSTDPFHTAREEPERSQSNRAPPVSSTEGENDTFRTGERVRSLEDFHNIPATQQEEEIEIPRLSGLDEHGEDMIFPGSSPASPSAKRRKVTYTAKRSVFRSPSKPKRLGQAPPANDAQAQQVSRDNQQAEEAQLSKAVPTVPHMREEVETTSSKAAILKSKVPQRKAKTSKQKQGSLKTVPREVIQSLASPGTSPNRLKPNDGDRPQTPISSTEWRGQDRTEQTDVDMPDANVDQDSHAEAMLDHTGDDQVAKGISDHAVTSPGDILLPNRVMASWPGSHYYPATCLGKTTGRQLQIRFDDGNIATLETSHVRLLKFDIGDQVKVDASGMKRHTYVVVGFKDKVDDLEGEKFPVTDIYGHSTVVLEEKQRDSLPAAKAIEQAEHVSVPVGSLYLTTQLWTRFRNRTFHFSPPASPSKSDSRLGTPLVSTEAIVTPSFMRRSTTVPSLLRDATTRGASVASSSARSGSGTFTNMAFALTSTAADVDKDAISRILKTNGGLILEQGFHELFELDSREAISSSQSRGSSVDGLSGLVLKEQYKNLGFVALISDSHSRSTKYIQALALNVPCLHLRWVNDSLAASRPVSFAKYLLPAGVSKFLDPNGAIRSRTMTTYDPSAEDVSFAQVISRRDLLLQDQTVLLVTGKSKKDIEKRQPFVFLTHALGSAHVGRCADLATARGMMNDSQWNWIYVDNGEQGVADAAAELLGKGKPASSGKAKKSRKRKRDATEEKEELVVKGVIAEKNVKITCSEFVIQSLILGALIEE